MKKGNGKNGNEKLGSLKIGPIKNWAKKSEKVGKQSNK